MAANDKKEILSLFGKLLEYPDIDFQVNLSQCEHLASSLDSEFKNDLKKFLSFAKSTSLDELQELYVKTFELDPVCAPYAGVHIFGEDGFKRGAFMARLKQAYSEHGISTTSELPDHISVILQLASKLKETDKFNDLLSECVLEPLKPMLSSFKDDSNPYKQLVLSIRRIAEINLPKEDNNA